MSKITKMEHHRVWSTLAPIFLLFLLSGCRVVNQSVVETIPDPKILLCSISGDDTDAALLAQDKLIYQNLFKNISEHNAASVKDFYVLVGDKHFDIVHLSVGIESNGTIAGEPAVEFLKNLTKENVKLVVFARNMSSDSAIEAFHASKTGSIRTNWIETLDRKGERFGKFFRQLFDEMAKGETLFTAWAKIAPQADGPWMESLPDTIFIPNRGDVRFIP